MIKKFKLRSRPDEKPFKQIKEEISWIVNICLASSRIKKLTFQEPERDYNARPTLHTVLCAPIGNIKSTILEQIGGEINQEVMLEVTKPGLVGTIDQKTMQIIPGAAWTCRNSMMLIDEFNFAKKGGSWETLLQLTESQRWTKRFGVFSTRQEFFDGDLYLKVDSGSLSLKTRFSCLIGTMKRFELMRGQNFRAFLSRTVPYNFSLSEHDIEEILNGKMLFDLKIPKIQEEVFITTSKYMKIKRNVINAMKKETNNEWIRKELMLRTVGDCCRIFAVTGKNDKKWINRIVGYKIQNQQKIGKVYKETKK